MLYSRSFLIISFIVFIFHSLFWVLFQIPSIWPAQLFTLLPDTYPSLFTCDHSSIYAQGPSLHHLQGCLNPIGVQSLASFSVLQSHNFRWFPGGQTEVSEDFSANTGRSLSSGWYYPSPDFTSSITGCPALGLWSLVGNYLSQKNSTWSHATSQRGCQGLDFPICIKETCSGTQSKPATTPKVLSILTRRKGSQKWLESPPVARKQIFFRFQMNRWNILRKSALGPGTPLGVFGKLNNW